MRAPDFWNRSDLMARALSAALAPVGWLYGASVAWKRDHATPYRPKAKVICVGNITVGGSGKTPVAIAIAQALIAGNIRVAILTRGYGGELSGPLLVDVSKHTASDIGDEPLLLTEVAPTIVAHDRKAGAELADSMGVDVIIMDDGHQNFSLVKDLSIVVVDGETGFGNGCILPAGPLREPAKQGLARADAVIVMGPGSPALPGYRGPVLRARISPARMPPPSGRVVAFAGIGRPSKFFASLKASSLEIVAAHAFADHHRYTASEIDALKREAAGDGATLLTTEKDFVRLPTDQRAGIEAVSVYAAWDEPTDFQRVLDKFVARVQAQA